MQSIPKVCRFSSKLNFISNYLDQLFIVQTKLQQRLQLTFPFVSDWPILIFQAMSLYSAGAFSKGFRMVSTKAKSPLTRFSIEIYTDIIYIILAN